jgi:phospholipid/cholesterol/gamma-HCH transport system substrate-binding protein
MEQPLASTLRRRGVAVSRSLSFLQAVILGVVVLAALGLAGFGLFAVGGRGWLAGDFLHIQVGFRQIRGVEVGTRVRVQGVDAGEIVGVQLPETPGQDVSLSLRLQGRFRKLIRTDATAQIVSEGMIGGKVVEIDPGTADKPSVIDGTAIASKRAPELTDLLNEAGGLLQDVRNGKGSVGKLLTDDQLYQDLVGLLQQGRGTLTSIQQDADAIKDMPIVRSYVKDAHKLLVRPECERYAQPFSESDLFETGQAALTARGRGELDKLVPWLEGLKHKGSEVVVASYADPGSDPKLALTLTQKQSEAICKYLVDQHSVQKMGWVSRRTVTPIGLGTVPPPVPDKDQLRPPRIEVLVFVPRG